MINNVGREGNFNKYFRISEFCKDIHFQMTFKKLALITVTKIKILGWTISEFNGMPIFEQINC